MVDPYLFLAPVLLLGVVALLRFVGCFINPSPTSVTVNVTFENSATTAGKVLDGLYKTLIFSAGSDKWYWKDSGGNSIYIGPASSNTPAFASFSFATALGVLQPGVLQSIEVFNDGATPGDITLSDGVNPDKLQTIPVGLQLTSVVTGWGNASGTVRVQSSVGWNLNIVSITYQAPA